MKSVEGLGFVDHMRDVLYIEFVRAAEDIERDAQDPEVGETVGKWLRARARLFSEKGGTRVIIIVDTRDGTVQISTNPSEEIEERDTEEVSDKYRIGFQPNPPDDNEEDEDEDQDSGEDEPVPDCRVVRRRCPDCRC